MWKGEGSQKEGERYLCGVSLYNELGSGKQSGSDTFDSSMGALIFIISVSQRSSLKQERTGGFLLVFGRCWPEEHSRQANTDLKQSPRGRSEMWSRWKIGTKGGKDQLLSQSKP